MDYSGTYAVEADELSDKCRTLLKEMDDSLIAFTSEEREAKLILLKKARFKKNHILIS
jgi:hypothetical protein